MLSATLQFTTSRVELMVEATREPIKAKTRSIRDSPHLLPASPKALARILPMVELFEQYDLDTLEIATSLPGVDLRYSPATNDPLLLAMLSRQGMDLQSQFESTWLSL